MRCEKGNVSWHSGWVQGRHWGWDKAGSVCCQTASQRGRERAQWELAVRPVVAD